MKEHPACMLKNHYSFKSICILNRLSMFLLISSYSLHREKCLNNWNDYTILKKYNYEF